MAKEFAKRFYESAAWQQARWLAMEKAHWLCNRCKRPALIVHHKTALTPLNITNLDIALGQDNLEALCLECHNFIHAKNKILNKNLMFTEDGDIKEIPPG